MGFIGYFVKLIHIPMCVLPLFLLPEYTDVSCSNNILVYVPSNTLIRITYTDGSPQRRRISYLFGVRRLWATCVLYSRAYIIAATSYPAPLDFLPLPALGMKLKQHTPAALSRDVAPSAARDGYNRAHSPSTYMFASETRMQHTRESRGLHTEKIIGTSGKSSSSAARSSGVSASSNTSRYGKDL
jgi:hypothetical protein